MGDGQGCSVGSSGERGEGRHNLNELEAGAALRPPATHLG